MGVADSPDLANAYGWFFERWLDVLNNPVIPFYGRYIDDICCIVYASSEAEALNAVKYIKFDSCTIEWTASDTHAAFLDMCLYKDQYNGLQHMPYRKSRNHMERIPWVSHHPLDVKRGTFIGEMSRLATLSSTHSVYQDALSNLVALYVKRGYPIELCHKWLKDNMTKRWQNRLNEVRPEREDVLVLKGQFNTAWNYFNARELGDKLLGFWRTWLARAQADQYDGQYPLLSAEAGDLPVDLDGNLTVTVRTSDGPRALPDVRKLDILNRKKIVSRKHTRNLFDLTSLWKKIVITRLEEDASSSGSQMSISDPETDRWNDEQDPLAAAWNVRHGLV